MRVVTKRKEMMVWVVVSRKMKVTNQGREKMVGVVGRRRMKVVRRRRVFKCGIGCWDVESL